MSGYYLITSTETGRKYKRKTLKDEYKNIKNGQIQKVYLVKRNIGFINNGKVYRTKRS